MKIAYYDVKRILIDNGSSIDILFYSIFSQMHLSTDRLRKIMTLLVSLMRDTIGVEGEITHLVTIRTEP